MTDSEEYEELYLKCGICCTGLIDPPLRPPRICWRCHDLPAEPLSPIPHEEWERNE